jgi:hypothetical protein
MMRHLIRLGRGLGIMVIILLPIAAIVGSIKLLLVLGDNGYGTHVFVVFSVLLIGGLAYSIGSDFE